MSLMEQKPKKKNQWFGKIESREDALKVIKDSSNGFYVIAAIQAGIGVFLAPSMILDGVIYAVLGFLLRKFNSRVVAVLLLLFSALSVFATASNQFGRGGTGGSNIVLAVIILWAAVRAVQATFKLPKLK